MFRVRKLGFIGLRSVNVDAMEHYYGEVVGLRKQHHGKEVQYFACGPDHHAVSLHADSRPGVDHIGLEIDRNVSLPDVQRSLCSAGVQTEIQTNAIPGVAQCLKLIDPDGSVIYLYPEIEGSKQPYAERGGIAPNKLGHVAYFVENAKRSETFFSSALGFRWSDWVEDVFLFMRCNSDHHTLNFLQSSKRGLFHYAFELHDFSHVGRACDILANNKMRLLWGPGRHGAGHNIFIYHSDPDGNTVEYFTELDKMLDEELGHFDPRPYHEDSPQRPKIWPHHPLSGNKWGVKPPEGFGAINLASKGA